VARQERLVLCVWRETKVVIKAIPMLPPTPPRSAPALTLTRQQRRTTATRAKLLTAARHIFARDGFEASRLEDIAARAGFTRGAFYANFDSKEDLLFALMERVVTEKVQAIQALLERRQTPQERQQTLREYYASLAGDRHWCCCCWNSNSSRFGIPRREAGLSNVIENCALRGWSVCWDVICRFPAMRLPLRWARFPIPC
jgi:AcrR family transcriptional regulator